MKKSNITKPLIFGILALTALFAFAKQEKKIQIFRNGEVIQEYLSSEIDYIEVSDVEDQTINGHEYVDLGLPSGLKWATCNVGMYPPIGDYFAWGEVEPKSFYEQENSLTFGKDTGEISGNPQYDAARANWGGTWRLPSSLECQELIDKCSWTWTTQSGMEGYEVTGPNGNSIFLPAAEYRWGIVGLGPHEGFYWTSTPYAVGRNRSLAYALYFNSNDKEVGTDVSFAFYRYYGFCVRAVSE